MALWIHIPSRNTQRETIAKRERGRQRYTNRGYRKNGETQKRFKKHKVKYEVAEKEFQKVKQRENTVTCERKLVFSRTNEHNCIKVIHVYILVNIALYKMS